MPSDPSPSTPAWGRGWVDGEEASPLTTPSAARVAGQGAAAVVRPLGATGRRDSEISAAPAARWYGPDDRLLAFR